MRFFSKRILFTLSVVALLIISVFVSVNLTKKTQNIKSRADYTSPLKATGVSNTLFDYSNMRSVMFFLAQDISSDSFIPKLQSELPAIKSYGFNTIGLFPLWVYFQPQALPTPTYNEAAFTKFRQILQILKDNNMRTAFYLGTYGPGWIPAGVSACPISNTGQWQAYVNFTAEFLRRIEDYNDYVYPMIYTESAWFCAQDFQTQHSYLANTMGTYPDQLPRELRNKFRIGIHDGNFLNVNGTNFMPNPNPYDFISLLNYNLMTDNQSANNWIDQYNVGKVRQIYPDIPVIFFETGGNACGYAAQAQANQTRALTNGLGHMMDIGAGFNIWSWIDNTEYGCGGDNTNGGIVKTSDSSPLQAASALRDMFVQKAAKPWPASINSPSPTPVPSTGGKLKKGDTNNDGVVNSIDFSYLKLKFKSADSNADLNKNGKVDYPDYSILFSNWGR